MQRQDQDSRRAELERAFPNVEQVTFAAADAQPSWIKGDLGQLTPGELETAAEAYMKRVAPAFKLNSGDDVKVVHTSTDQLGMTHVRMHQEHLGIPVDGGDIYLHLDAKGTVRAINGHLGTEIRQAPVPGISQDKALELLQDHEGATDVAILTKPDLVYLSRPDIEPTLAWSSVVQWNDSEGFHQERIYIDAGDGWTLRRVSLMYDALYRKIYNANQSTAVPGTFMFQEGGSSSDQIAMAAYNNTGIVYNFYNTVFGRDSYNDNGANLQSSVHCTFSTGSGYTPNNAAWSDYYGQFLFGDGDGYTFDPLSQALDVIGHELTHAVTSSTANLEYQDESGALNEAMSDIFGAMCEAWDDGGVNSNTWKIGEDVYTPGTSGDALRYMNNPAADGSSPDYYPERYTGTSDYGGVHINAGIGTLAYYLASQGGTHPTGKTTVNVPAIGYTKARAIFYRALTQYMTTSTDFQGARTTTVQAAQDLYGSTEANAVDLAWDAVGVPGGTPQLPTELNNGVAVYNLSAATGNDLNYYIAVPSGASNLVIATSGGTGDADLYVRYGSQPTTTTYDYRPYLNGNNETVTVASPSAGNWYVMVHAYSTFSGLTLTASYDTGGNNPPNAGFTYTTNNLTANFTDTSTDSDGTIASRSWTFGDGGTSTSTNPSHTYASGGTYSVNLTVIDNDGANDSYSTNVTVSTGGGTTVLTNGVPVSNLSGATGDDLMFSLVVPTGASNLVFQMSGGTGDADMYVRYGAPPTTTTWDYRPYKSGNNETVNATTATAGTWYVMVHGYSAFSGVTLVGSYGTGGGGTQTDSVTDTVSARTSKYYNQAVSGGDIDLTLEWTGGYDLDLYLYNPSGTLVASSAGVSNPETISYNTNGVGGTYQIRVYNYSYSGTATFTLTATYQP